ncbi:hypothetical protein AHAS_Ahas01G0141900 [Arachis hypogaea]
MDFLFCVADNEPHFSYGFPIVGTCLEIGAVQILVVVVFPLRGRGSRTVECVTAHSGSPERCNTSKMQHNLKSISS